MRKLLLLGTLLLCYTFLLAQAPVNDDCGGLIDLGVAPFCPDPPAATEVYSNVDATASDIGFGNNPSCFNGGLAQRDVWFSFVCSDTLFDYSITIMGVEGPNGEAEILNPQVALYRGSCQVDGLAELACASAEDGENMVTLNIDGLTPGITYYLRVDDFSSTATPNWGSFKLCIDEQPQTNLITDGGSTDCQGVLYDSGGPEGDYENNENNVFTICPSQPHACINFGLTYFNLEGGEDFGFTLGDQLFFYDGEGTDPNTLIDQISGFDDFTFTESATSGVCYEVQATSGCLTVQFVSDGMVAFSGWEAVWECSTTPCQANEPIGVTLNPTENEIASALGTSQTQVTVTDIICDEVGYGLFTASDDTDLGESNGLLLTTGRAEHAIGPNTTSAGDFFFDDRGQPGDAELDILSELSGNFLESEDACVVELEVVANSNEISFEYVFGSEEYPEFANDIFNDVFAFLIEGEGITGIPELGGQENIATLPGTNTFVEINTVNSFTNWEYYRNTENSQSVQYDG
ncbi:MAG: choice-of-anchor L domain-containing protein, partial [Bacteroidota bacterium]